MLRFTFKAMGNSKPLDLILAVFLYINYFLTIRFVVLEFLYKQPNERNLYEQKAYNANA